MGSRLAKLAARREELIARSRSLRGEFRDNAERIHARLAWADRVVTAGRALRRSPILLGVGALVLLFGGKGVVRLIGTAYRYAPMALGAFQLARRDGALQERSRE